MIGPGSSFLYHYQSKFSNPLSGSPLSGTPAAENVLHANAEDYATLISLLSPNQQPIAVFAPSGNATIGLELLRNHASIISRMVLDTFTKSGIAAANRILMPHVSSDLDLAALKQSSILKDLATLPPDSSNTYFVAELLAVTRFKMAVPTDQFSAIYHQATRKYHEITGETLAVDFLAEIRSVSDLTKEIDKKNSTFREFREKRGSMFDVLEAALIPVQLFGDLAAGGASMVFPPSSLVFGAVMHLVGAAKGVSASYDAIQDLMQVLQDFTTRLRAYTQEAISEALCDKLSDIIVTLIEILALSSKTIRRGRLLKFTRNILLGNNDAIQAAMIRLDKLTQVEASLVGAETLTESKRAGRVVDGISMTVNATNTTVLETGMTVTEMSARVQEVQETLKKLVVSTKDERQVSNEDPEALKVLVKQVLRPSMGDSAQEWFCKIDKARVPGTGDWINQEAVFQSWINKEMPIIFVSGNPGAGKSFLAANMISFLLKQLPTDLQHNPPISIGYFFFKGDNPQTRSFHQTLRDLAFQISKGDLAYQKYIATVEEYEQISTLESAWRLLFTEYFVSKSGTENTTYILLDAVDETMDEERMLFINLAKELYENQSCLQLAIVGRPHISDQLLEGLEVKVPTIHVTKQKNSGDIIHYIQVSIKKSLILRRVSSKLREEIIDKLATGAEGMFLWVNLMVQELVKKRNETSMRKTLEQAPRGLKDTLRHVFVTFSESSSDEELEYLNETLLWVACADQPWTLSEIDAILKLKSPEGDGMIDLEGALRRQWASLFTLHREDGLTTAELENGSAHLDGFDWQSDEEKEDEHESCEEDYFMAFNSKMNTTTVTLSHASIGDFLRDESEGKLSAPGDHIGVGVNHHEVKPHIFKTYLRLITDPEFAAKANDAGHMLQHATRHWGEQLLSISPSECSLEDRRGIVKMLLTAFQSAESMSKWLERDNRALSMATIATVRQWWQEQDVHEFLSTEEKEFISATEDEPVDLFKPMVMDCVKRWLLEDTGNPDPMVSIVWRYQLLLKDEQVYDGDRNITAEEIVEAAEFGGFEKTSRWLRQCAIGLRQFWFLEEAFEYFEKAMELDEDDWQTLRELARTFEDQEDWEAAVELWKETRSSLLDMALFSPDGALDENLHDCLERMGQLYQGQEKREKRFKAVQEAYEYAPSCWTCIMALLEYHNENHAYQETIDLLKKLADTPSPDEDCSQLTQFLLVNVFDVECKSRLAAYAASATNELDFVLENWQTAARVARAASRTLIAVEVDMAIAKIYDEYLFDHMKAIRCWERVMDTYSSSSDGTLIGTIRHLASSNLARVFLCTAVEAGLETPEAEQWIVKLENLVDQSHSYPLGSYASVPAVYLGMYCRLRGEEDRARNLFRPLLQRSVADLRDNNPTNDTLTDLKYILMRAGDFQNVVALAHRSEEDNHELWYTCRGPCRRKTPKREGFCICPICLEGELCLDCVKLMEGTIPNGRCPSQHVKHFISIRPQSKETCGGMMLVDGKEMEFDAWLNQLKKEWVLGACNPSPPTADQFGFGDFLLGLTA
ncbi:hypothetical protein FE257_008487 [Aspergillus nanangensis]|uniref:Fungal STAND N-terminal Goodbye domain-containing protein n=1 Tax=Aspergillus nanangensis TaxID=2582783 RepID=A0AAD4CLC8_ASPNN|nr:hypothetical protein FE257_008487 [Aspergillus nanangensis]